MAAVARPVGKGRPVPAARTDRTLSQLQEAFARGALKPGLNVVLEERPKRRNDTVSRENPGPARGPSAGCGAQEALRGSGGSRRPRGAARGVTGTLSGPAVRVAPGGAVLSCAELCFAHRTA